MARYNAWLLLAALVLVLSVSTPAPANAAQGAEAGGETSPWRLPIALADDKLRIEWAEKAKLAVGGLFQGDWGYIKEDAFVTPSGWEGEVRRARIDIQAEALDRIFFRFEYDFSGTRGRLVEREIDYKDLYLGVRGLGPLGTFMVGYMKEPYSLQHLTYAGDRVFMEEALSTVFTPGRNFGLLLQNHHFDQRVTWAFGGFQNVTDDSGFFGEKGDWDVALRLTGLPVYGEGGRKLVHLGVAYVHTFRDQDATQAYLQRPEANIADPLPITGPFLSNGEDTFGGEIAVNYGPFQFQLEASTVWQSRRRFRTTHTKAAYIQAGVFLTGEHRPYDTEKGIFSRVRPNRPVFLKDSGWGAWQLSLRGSYLDLNTNVITDVPRAETYKEFGLSLNWYLTSNVRLDTNYLYLLDEGGSSIFLMRAQFEF